MSKENEKSGGKGSAIFFIIIALLIGYFIFYSPGNKKVETNTQTLTALKTEGLPRPPFVAEDQMLENLKEVTKPADVKTIRGVLADSAASSKTNLVIFGNNNKFPLNIQVTGPRAEIINVVSSVASLVSISEDAQIDGNAPLVNLENLKIIGTADNSTLTARLSSAY